MKKSLSLSPTIINKKGAKKKLKNNKKTPMIEQPATGKRKYSRRTLENSETPSGYKKKEYKCDNCGIVFKRKSKRNEHLNNCKNKNDLNGQKKLENSNDVVTLENLFNEGASDQNSNEQQHQHQYKTTSLQEDEFIIHNDDDEDDIRNSNLEIIYNN